MSLVTSTLTSSNASVAIAMTSGRGGACTKTLGPSADVARALSSASAGAVLCLRGGSYRTLELKGIDPGGYVTLRSLRGRDARIDGIEGRQIDFLRFSDLTVRAPVLIVQAAHDLRFTDDDLGYTSCGIYLYSWSPGGIRGVAISDSIIHDLDFTGPEQVCSGYGVQAVGGVDDVAITHSTIARTANDYVQLGGGDGWSLDHDLFLGPSLRSSHGGVHQDLWQVFGGGSNLSFTNNVARDTGTQESLLIQEGFYRDVKITNNLFDRDSEGYSVQLYQISGLAFTYNTFVGSHWGVLFRADDPDAGPGSGYVVEHNIFGATSSSSPDVSEQRDFGTYDYNVSQDGSASGAHSLRHWRARWVNRVDFQPLCLRLTAGYRLTSSTSRASLGRRWNSDCS